MTTRDTAEATPRSMGFAMPAEWERHEATWLTWPTNPTDWPDKLDTIRWVYTEIIRALVPGERVRVVVPSALDEKAVRKALTRSGIPQDRVEFVRHRTNRGWNRDSGPIFVKRKKGRREETAIVHLHFNAWAKYEDWQLDRQMPEVAAKVLGQHLFDARHRGRPFVLEGGGIDVNGRGTLLTTEECYLHPKVQVRNPGLGREGYEAAFAEWLGATNAFWLGGGIVGDDTHGHVDDLARFVDPRTIVLIRDDDKRSINYKPLAENWDRIADLRLEDGSKPEVVPLPVPGPLYFDNDRLPASYANFLIANAAVLVPTFNDRNDRKALGILGELFRDRPVVGIHAVDLVLGFGTVHCLTQQQPKRMLT
jgi:agmatine deiminase